MSARRTALFALPVLLGAALLLSGCVPTGTVGPSASPSDSPSTSPVPLSSATPTTTATVEPGEPVTIGCDQLITAQAIYDYNPNFSLISYTPASGSLAADAVASQGIACRWVNQTSGDTIDVSVAHLSETGLAARKSGLGTADSAFSVEGYFALQGSTGVAQVFSGPYWVTVSSVAFFEARDVAPLIDDAVAGLG